jgi:Domain of unknown function (DUF4157)
VSALTFATKNSVAPALARQAAPGAIRGGLRIGEPDDSYEREADRVANEVMTGGAIKRHWSLVGPRPGPTVQRKCGCGGSGGADGECEECKHEREEKTLRRKAAGTADRAFAPPIVHEVLSSPGRPLDRAARSFFETRFGQDLTSVRIHADASSAKSAEALNARAYTVGEHVVMNAGNYAPQSVMGRRLLAHELTHVLQQRGPGATEAPAAAQEREAHRAADALTRGTHFFPVQQHCGIGISKDPQAPQGKATPTITPEIKGALVQKLFDARRAAPPAGIRRNAVRTFAVAAIVSPDGTVTYKSAYYDTGTEHAEPQLLRLVAAEVKAGDTVAVAIDQTPCGANKANCAGALGEFREDPQHGSMRVYTVRALRKDVAPGTTPKTATPEQMVSPKTAITREPEEKFLVESVEFRRVRLPIYSGPETPEPTPGSKASPTTAAQAGDIAGDVKPARPPTTPETGEGEGTPARSPRMPGSAVSTGMTVFAAALMAFDLAQRFGILSDPLEQEQKNKINQLFHNALSQPQWDKRVQELQPDIDKASGNIFFKIAFRVVYAGHHSPHPKFPSQYTLKAVEIVSVDASKEETSGCGTLDPPDRPNSSIYSWEASTACTSSVKVKSGGQIRAEKRARENAAYLDKLRKEAAKTAGPPAPPSQEIGPPLLPTPGPQQQQAGPELLPGAPGPGPLEKARAVVADFKKKVLRLKSRGEGLLSQSPGRDEIESFKHAEEIWRTAALLAKNYFIDHGPDEGVRGMDELLNSDEYGGRLKQIRRTFGD